MDLGCWVWRLGFAPIAECVPTGAYRRGLVEQGEADGALRRIRQEPVQLLLIRSPRRLALSTESARDRKAPKRRGWWRHRRLPSGRTFEEVSNEIWWTAGVISPERNPPHTGVIRDVREGTAAEQGQEQEEPSRTTHMGRCNSPNCTLSRFQLDGQTIFFQREKQMQVDF